jgi:hypothetical protein
MYFPLPNSDPRYDADGEQIVRMFFSPEDLRMYPEEYAARHAQDWGCFSLHLYRYRDAALGAWIRRLAELLFDQDQLEYWRERLLTPEEQAEMRRRAAEDF